MVNSVCAADPPASTPPTSPLHITLSLSRSSSGAVKAAAWLIGRAPGRYSMNDVLGLDA